MLDVIFFFLRLFGSVLMDCFNPAHGVVVEFLEIHTTGSGNLPSGRQSQRRITRTINGRRQVDRSTGDDQLSVSCCMCVSVGYRTLSVGDAKSERIRSKEVK